MPSSSWLAEELFHTQVMVFVRPNALTAGVRLASWMRYNEGGGVEGLGWSRVETYVEWGRSGRSCLGSDKESSESEESACVGEQTRYERDFFRRGTADVDDEDDDEFDDERS